MTAPLLEQLIDALRVLPGVGQKSAQRMAYHLLERQRDGGRRLADALEAAMERIGNCERCRDFSETPVCPVCASSARDPQLLGLDRLGDRLADGQTRELILATNPTVEGEATAHYLAQLARQHGVRPSRPAHGLPLGGELEYVDRGTLSHAFGSRSEVA
jgi:recombination protein RecR